MVELLIKKKFTQVNFNAQQPYFRDDLTRRITNLAGKLLLKYYRHRCFTNSRYSNSSRI